MAVASGQVAVPITAGGTLLVPAANASAQPPGDAGRGVTRSVALINTGSQTVYLGASGLTAATGYPLLANATVTIGLYADEAIYGLSASGTQTVAYLESGS